MRALLALACALLLCASPSSADETLLTKEEALELAFKDCKVSRSTVTLTKEQKARVKELTGAAPSKSLVYPYVATKDGKIVGTAYFDVHKVRTLREVLMVVVDPKGKISRIEVLAFGEPKEYMPRASWYAQFVGKGLDETLSLKKGIKKVTGATLTARATTDAARRVLAIHQVRTTKPTPPPKAKEAKKGGKSK